MVDLEIIVDTRERYPYRFSGQAVTTVARALPCGDYGLVVDGRLVAAVERKSLSDLVSSVTNGKLRYALGDLAVLPRAAVVVEDRYSALFKQRHARPAVVADALAEYQVRWPTVPTVFCETRSLAEEWTYRLPRRRLAMGRYGTGRQPAPRSPDPLLLSAPYRPEPTVGEVRSWARNVGLDRSRSRPAPPRNLGCLEPGALTSYRSVPIELSTEVAPSPLPRGTCCQ